MNLCKSELKPCPFCGAKSSNSVDILGGTVQGKTRFYATCFKCKARANHFARAEKAREAWNQRAENGGGENA